MKLRGRIPITGDEVEVDLLLPINIPLFVIYSAAPFWQPAMWLARRWYYLDPIWIVLGLIVLHWLGRHTKRHTVFR